MVGQTISHYKILEILGSGGMGIVYKAEDTKLHRTVALKFLPTQLTTDKIAKDRFIREAQAASSLQHNNICTIHEIDETKDGQFFISMDYYEGETLKNKMSKELLSIDEIIAITTQIAEGLNRAHEKGIIHRDIKPANIFIT
ncbi:MAG: serine/threonine protein kinase, partial [Ignavibacteria bacterium]|nr:serine/threonine protein kinase [Ignavibacteria bacterium]